MRKLIVLSAIPGSGKSTWAEQYKASHPGTIIVSSDEIRKELFGAPNVFANEKLVWDTYLKRLNEHVHEKNITVIADATHLSNSLRKMYVELTPDFDFHELVIFKLPYELCLYQNKMREKEKVVPLVAMERLRSEHEEPSDEIKRLYDKIDYIEDYLSDKALDYKKKALG